MAELAVRRGRWDEARSLAAELLAAEATAKPTEARALAILATVAIRRGDGDPWPFLDRAIAIVENAERTQDLAMVRTARMEAALSEGDRDKARNEGELLLTLTDVTEGDPSASESTYWAWRVGAIADLPTHVLAPFRLQAAGEGLEAARAWHEIGCPYYEAVALAETNHAEHLLEALSILHKLGAAPAAQAVTDQLRALGAAQIPRGPRQRTRTNPFGLTDREMEVLALLGASMRNAEIAARLVLSPKTVDHHVASVLRKLEVHDRAAAGAVARDLGLKYGVTAAKDRESAISARS
jgi:DNA-binding NarL/FixJ family response regulator